MKLFLCRLTNLIETVAGNSWKSKKHAVISTSCDFNPYNAYISKKRIYITFQKYGGFRLKSSLLSKNVSFLIEKKATTLLMVELEVMEHFF